MPAEEKKTPSEELLDRCDYRRRSLLRDLQIIEDECSFLRKTLKEWDVDQPLPPSRLNPLGHFQNITKFEAQLSNLIATVETVHKLKPKES